MEGNTSITTKYTERQRRPLTRTDRTESSEEVSKASETEKLFTEGSRLHARITDFVGKRLTLRLADGTTVNASTSAGSHLAIGQTAEFEVMLSGPDQLLLKLIKSDDQNNSNSMAGRALTAAGLPLTEENISLVNTLLDNRLPVNTESLQTLSKAMKMFPNADPATLAAMQLHKMPINSRTIAQYEAYSNFEHQLMPKLTELAESLDTPEFTALLKEAGFEFRLPEYREADTPAPAQFQGMFREYGDEGLSGELGGFGTESPLNVRRDVQEFSENASPVQTTEGSENTGRSDAPGATATEPQAAEITAKDQYSINNSGSDANNTVNGSDATEKKIPQGNDRPGSENALREQASGASNAAEKAPGRTDTSESKGISFLKRWTLTPGELSKENAVENMYERLNSDLKELEKAIRTIKEKHPETDAELSKLIENAQQSAEKLKDNLEFMNVLNRYFPYVQLPVRLKDSFTQGELYVYKRNRSKKADGSSSVLLHLDMEHLGSTDVYLNLAGNNLTSRFYLSSEEAMNLFENNISQLTEKLNSLGLSVNYEILSHDEAEAPVHEFLSAGGSGEVSHYRFDRKA